MRQLTNLGDATRGAAAAWLRRLARHERAVTAVLVALGVLAGLTALRPAEARMVTVVTAAHALPGGATLTASDLAAARLPARAVPDQAITDPREAIGLVVVAPMSRGEPLTALRVAGAALINALRPGSVAVPVRLSDAGVAALLHVGDHLDLLAVPRDGGPSRTVAGDAIVIVVPTAGTGLDEGTLIVVACTPAVAQQLAAAAVSSHISVVLRGH